MRTLLRLEKRREPRAHWKIFLSRLFLYLLASAVLVVGSLAAGMYGYEHYEGLGWRDAFLNAAMLLGGMGPVWQLQTPDGKVFAGLYALYAGLVFLVAAGVALAPVIHRVIHSFHLDHDRGGE